MLPDYLVVVLLGSLFVVDLGSFNCSLLDHQVASYVGGYGVVVTVDFAL